MLCWHRRYWVALLALSPVRFRSCGMPWARIARAAGSGLCSVPRNSDWAEVRRVSWVGGAVTAQSAGSAVTCCCGFVHRADPPERQAALMALAYRGIAPACRASPRWRTSQNQREPSPESDPNPDNLLAEHHGAGAPAGGGALHCGHQRAVRLLHRAAGGAVPLHQAAVRQQAAARRRQQGAACLHDRCHQAHHVLPGGFVIRTAVAPQQASPNTALPVHCLVISDKLSLLRLPESCCGSHRAG